MVDVPTVARERSDAGVELLQAQLDRALDALIAARLVGTPGDLTATRRVLLDLYGEQILTKAQVRERGALAADEFHDLLRAHRCRKEVG